MLTVLNDLLKYPYCEAPVEVREAVQYATSHEKATCFDVARHFFPKASTATILLVGLFIRRHRRTPLDVHLQATRSIT